MDSTSQDMAKGINSRSEKKNIWFHNATMDIIAYSLILFCIIGSVIIYSSLQVWYSSRNSFSDKQVEFGEFKNLLPMTFVYFLAFYVIHQVFQKFLFNLSLKLLDDKALQTQ